MSFNIIIHLCASVCVCERRFSTQQLSWLTLSLESCDVCSALNSLALTVSTAKTYKFVVVLRTLSKFR